MGWRTSLADWISGKAGAGGQSEPAGTSNVNQTVFFGQDWFNRGYDTPGFRDTLLSTSAVAACIDILSQDVAKLPIRLWKIRPGNQGRDLVSNHPLVTLFEQPNYYQTRVEFFILVMMSLLYRGNSYIFVERNRRNEPIALYPLMPDRVAAFVGPQAEIFYSVGRDPMRPQLNMSVLPQRFVIHPRLRTMVHPLIGVTPLYAAAYTAQALVQMTKQTSIFFKKMSRPSGVLTAPTMLKQEVIDRLRTQWEEYYGGENTGRTAVLEAGLDWKQLTMSAVDAQLVQLLEWGVKDVARAFRVPAFLIGEMDKMTYRNSETLMRLYYTGTLSYYLELLEESFNTFFGLYDQNMELEFDADQMLRMELDARMTAGVKAIQGGIKTPNEVRAKEGLNPMDGGELLYMQGQMTPLTVLADPPPPVAPGTALIPTTDSEEGGESSDNTEQPVEGEDSSGGGKPANEEQESAASRMTRMVSHELYSIREKRT